MGVLVVILSTYTAIADCTVGVVAGTASADGRPIAFKNRDFDFAYQAVSYVTGGTYRYIGIGNSGSNSPLMGLNERGLALGNSVMSNMNGGSGNVTCMDWLLKNCSTVDQCRTALRNDTYSGARPSFSLPIIGNDGKAYHIEKGASYFEYDPLDYGPTKVRKYAIIVRTNVGHQNSDGSDDSTTGGIRYYEARDHLHNAVIKNGIFDTDPSDSRGVTIDEVIKTLRWGNPGYEGDWTSATGRNCNSTSLSTMIAHGVNAGEDPQIAVMWTTVYKADYVCFVPVWVALGINGEIPARIANGGDATRLSYQADRIYARKDPNNYDQYVNSRLEPMEANFIQAAADARDRWIRYGFAYKEAKRICTEAVETGYWTVKTIADQAQTAPRALNETPLISQITADIQGTAVAFSHNATDPDGSISSVFWEFGDDSTSTNSGPGHTYKSGGTYLVMCRAIDNAGSRNSRWEYITVGSTAIAAVPAAKAPELISYISARGTVAFTARLDAPGPFTLSVYTIKGSRLWEYSAAGQGSAGSLKIYWKYSSSEYRISNETCIAQLAHNGKKSVLKFAIVR